MFLDFVSLCLGGWKKFILTSILLFSALPFSRSHAVPLYEQDDFKIILSGHVQDLITGTDDPYYALEPAMTLFGPVPVPVTGRSTNNTTRLRTVLRVLTGTRLSAEADIDATYACGSAVGSLLFQLGKDREPATFFNWERAYVDTRDAYGKVSVYRAVVTWEDEKFRVVAGRQRLAYGTALFWSPIDIWNPVSPLALEPEEKTGVDGVSATWWIADNVSATALYGAADTWDETRLAGSVSFSIESYTFDALAGKRGEDMVYGFDFVGYVGGAGLRGEFTYTVAHEAEDYLRAVIGLDYAWPNSLYLAGEYYHNGGPLTIDPADPLAAYFEATGVDSLHRNFAGLMASYDLDPLVKGSLAVIYDLDEASEAFAPSVSWSVSDNFTVSAGAQFFEGSESGEYGQGEDLAWFRGRVDF